MVELKPCPLCGSKAMLRKSYIDLDGGAKDYFTYIECTNENCRCRTRDYFEWEDKSTEEILEVWNRRV